MQQTVFTIGHSTHALEHFISVLLLHKITALCDVRSTPYSRVNSQFNQDDLKPILQARNIKYLFLGKELGARSDDPICYENGKVQYDRLAKTELFQSGLERIQSGMKQGFQIALMCAEKEPLECHRTILVARHLVDLGIDVQHIHANGKLESHTDALNRLAWMFNLYGDNMFCSRDALLADIYLRQEERIAYEENESVSAETPRRRISVG
jgi:uncharacterized protein (DUF488 family)